MGGYFYGIIVVMKLVVLYRPNSEHARVIEDFMRDFERQVGIKARTEILNIDTREGAAAASLYDIVQYPGLLVTTDDGQMLHSWEGTVLPLMNEVASYLRS